MSHSLEQSIAAVAAGEGTYVERIRVFWALLTNPSLRKRYSDYRALNRATKALADSPVPASLRKRIAELPEKESESAFGMPWIPVIGFCVLAICLSLIVLSDYGQFEKRPDLALSPPEVLNAEQIDTGSISEITSDEINAARAQLGVSFAIVHDVFIESKLLAWEEIRGSTIPAISDQFNETIQSIQIN